MYSDILLFRADEILKQKKIIDDELINIYSFVFPIHPEKTLKIKKHLDDISIKHPVRNLKKLSGVNYVFLIIYLKMVEYCYLVIYIIKYYSVSDKSVIQKIKKIYG